MKTLSVDALESILGELRSAGEMVDPGLLERARALGEEAVRPLIAMAVDRSLHQAPSGSPEVWGPIHAIHILGALGAEEALEPLLSLLDDDDVDDALSHALEAAFAGIGAAALDPLRARFLDGGRSALSRYPLARCIAAIGRDDPELRVRAIAALVDRLDPAHSQVPEDEELNAFAICALGSLGAVEAEAAIRRAFAEDRVDTMIVGLDDVLVELGLAEASVPDPPPEGLRLVLLCTGCQYSRPHDVRRVYLDLTTWERRERGEKTKYDPCVIPQRIHCPRCGAVDRYTFSGHAYLALTAEMLRRAIPKHGISAPGDDAPRSALVLTRFSVADGRRMHPLEARDEYCAQVAASPGRPDLRVRYGNVLVTLGYHAEARAEYRAAVELQPTNAEAWLNLASLAWEAGDEAEARPMLEQVIAVAPHDALSEERRARFPRTAREALDGDATALQEMHAFQPCPIPPERRPEPAARPLAAVRQGPKVGRNEPCPCGSGKKYKKCHGG